MRVLDLGCGRGFYTKALALLHPQSQISGVDINEDYLAKAGEITRQHSNVTLQKADARSLPWSDDYFDRIICSEVLEHIIEDRKVVKQAYRVLRKSGKAIFTVPNKNYPLWWDPLNWYLEHFFHTHIPSQIWWLDRIWADHVRLYTQTELVTKIKRAGFQIERGWHSTHYCLPFAHFLLYGIGKNLVEKSLVGESLNRFAVDTEPSLLTKVAQAPFFLFDRFNQEDMPGRSVVNLLVKVWKPAT